MRRLLGLLVLLVAVGFVYGGGGGAPPNDSPPPDFPDSADDSAPPGMEDTEGMADSDAGDFAESDPAGEGGPPGDEFMDAGEGMEAAMDGSMEGPDGPMDAAPGGEEEQSPPEEESISSVVQRIILLEAKLEEERIKRELEILRNPELAAEAQEEEMDQGPSLEESLDMIVHWVGVSGGGVPEAFVSVGLPEGQTPSIPEQSSPSNSYDSYGGGDDSPAPVLKPLTRTYHSVRKGGRLRDTSGRTWQVVSIGEASIVVQNQASKVTLRL